MLSRALRPPLGIRRPNLHQAPWPELLSTPDVESRFGQLRDTAREVARLVKKLGIEERWQDDFEPYQQSQQAAAGARQDFCTAATAVIATVLPRSGAGGSGASGDAPRIVQVGARLAGATAVDQQVDPGQTTA